MLNQDEGFWRRAWWLVVDAACVCIGAVLAYWVRFDFDVPAPYPTQMMGLMPVFVAANVVTLYYCGWYRGIGRYFGLSDAYLLVRATLVGTIFVLTADHFRNYTIAWILAGVYLLSVFPYRSIRRIPRYTTLSLRARRLILAGAAIVSGAVLLAAVGIFRDAPLAPQSPVGNTAIGRWVLTRDFLYNLGIPRSVVVLEWILTTGLLGLVHLSPRLVREASHRMRRNIARRVLIIGAGDAGEMIAREMNRNPRSAYDPVGFIDDNQAKRQARIHGLEVLGTRHDIDQVVQSRGVDEILIAIPSLRGPDLADLVRHCRSTQVPIKTVPGIQDILGGGFRVEDLKALDTATLLGRDEVLLEVQEVSAYVRDRVVMVTGAGGSIGSELCRQIASYKPSAIVMLGRGENSIFEIHRELMGEADARTELHTVIADVRDRPKLESVFSTYKPDVVFHAAAHKHVHLMEQAPDEAVKNNVFGTINAAELAKEHRAGIFLLISTDKAVNPTSAMGASKRVAEMAVQEIADDADTKFVVVRFGNVIRSRGSVIPIFEKQIREGGPVTITHPDVTRYFMSIPEAVHLVLRSASVAESGSICVLDMGKPVRILDLAQNLIRMAGLRPEEDIRIEFTGLKPGEKLSEEILSADASPTKVEGVFIARENGLPVPGFAEHLQLLRDAAHNADAAEVKRLVQTIVPDYCPSTASPP